MPSQDRTTLFTLLATHANTAALKTALDQIGLKFQEKI